MDTTPGLSMTEFLLYVLLPAVAGLIAAFFMFGGMYFRWKSNGATMIKYWDSVKKEQSELIKLGNRTSFTIGKHESGMVYVVDQEKIHFTDFPGGFPSFMQNSVPTFYYRLDTSEPIDPTGESLPRIITPNMLHNMVNEEMLRTMAAEARESAEGSLLPFRKLPQYIFYLGVINVVGLGALLFLTFEGDSMLKEILQILGAG